MLMHHGSAPICEDGLVRGKHLKQQIPGDNCSGYKGTDKEGSYVFNRLTMKQCEKLFELIEASLTKHKS